MDDEHSPLDSPDGNWWNREVNRRETIWLGITGAWALSLFGWMFGWTRFGGQNQTGETIEIDPEEFTRKFDAYTKRATTTTYEGTEVLVPPGQDVFVKAQRYSWGGLPFLIEAGTEYTFHLSSVDVQHGFSVRDQANLSQQISLQVLPGYEWQIDMRFDDPGTYRVVCNEFCGAAGHRIMVDKFYVRE